MIENHAGVCLDHEHDWCSIPLHEDVQICAKCGEIKEPPLSDPSEASDPQTDSDCCLRFGGAVGDASIIPNVVEHIWSDPPTAKPALSDDGSAYSVAWDTRR